MLRLNNKFHLFFQEVDSDDIKDLNVSNHRSHLALVSQEPVLFGRTIAENIAYGNNACEPDMNEIIEAARQANIHGFVSSLPQVCPLSLNFCS